MAVFPLWLLQVWVRDQKSIRPVARFDSHIGAIGGPGHDDNDDGEGMSMIMTCLYLSIIGTTPAQQSLHLLQCSFNLMSQWSQEKKMMKIYIFVKSFIGQCCLLSINCGLNKHLARQFHKSRIRSPVNHHQQWLEKKVYGRLKKQMWVGGGVVSNFYKSLFLWHILPFFELKSPKCQVPSPKYPHKFGPFVPNKTVFKASL